jgi:hypothetical protein
MPLDLRVRDILYRDAEQYFEFGGINDKEAVSTAREALQKAVNDMQRTEAKQQSCKDEVDMLESELGF